jgi:hypothetical protein
MEDRLKLLGIVTLVYAFLLDLIFSDHQELVEKILRLKCHRTGSHGREALVPLYRLRWAICRLWNDSRPLLAPTAGSHARNPSGFGNQNRLQWLPKKFGMTHISSANTSSRFIR